MVQFKVRLMSQRLLRSSKLLDYQIFHETGDRVYKSGREDNIVMDRKKDSEKKIASRIDRFLTQNADLSEFFDLDEIDGSIRELRELLESYEDLHIELKGELGDQEYSETYDEYSKNVQKMEEWLKKSRTEVRSRKQKFLCKGRDSLRIEEEFFRSRITRDLESLEKENSSFVEDLERHTSIARELIRSYAGIFLRIKEEGAEFAKEFQGLYDTQIETLEKFIQTRRDSISNLRQKEKTAEDERRKSEEQKKNENKKAIDQESVLLCKNIYDNICDRMKKLETKCGIKTSSLSDLQIMDLKKDMKSIDVEYTGIIDKILKLTESKPSRYTETENLAVTVSDRKAELNKIIDTYKTSLDAEISKRDLTEDKIKSASLLGIKLSKFKGYNSTLDYYTFKSEFEKLVAPRIQSHLQSDYLKHNYLDGQALQLVKEIDDVSEIWKRLKSSYGNVSTLLNSKLESLEKSTPLWKVNGDEKVVEAIINLKNLMMELSTMSEKHSVEHSLYHTSNLSKIYGVLGKRRQIEFTKQIVDDEKTEAQIWEELIKFLDSELKVKEKVLLYSKTSPKPEEPNKPRNKNDGQSSYPVVLAEKADCTLCGQPDHVPTVTKRGRKIICYHACEKFALMKVKERFELLKSKNLCFQCLSPGMKAGHKGRCFDRYKCPDQSHKGFRSGLHVLVCDSHKGKPENLKLLEEYKKYCIEDGGFKEFTINIGISLHVNDESSYKALTKAGIDTEDEAIYMFQTIQVGHIRLNLFFDGGCSDMVITKSAVDKLMGMNKAENLLEGPLILSGVGDLKSVCPHGRFQISIPLHNGNEAKLSGICLDKITCTFPVISLDLAGKDLREGYRRELGDPSGLPGLPTSVGGETDIMIGIKNNKYFPRELFRMENGLAIYESQFKSVDGSRGVLAGPHSSFNNPERSSVNHVGVYLTQEAAMYCLMHRLGLEVGLLDQKVSPDFSPDLFQDSDSADTDDDNFPEFSADSGETPTKHPFVVEHYTAKAVPRCLKKFEEVDSAGTEASYRCIRCRGCKNCIKSAQIECISLREEQEQGLIEKSVTVDPEGCFSEAYLPFLCDPTKKLVTNFHRALKFYMSQVKMLVSKPNDKEDLIAAMKKLFVLGFARKFDDLTEQQKAIINASPVKYYIPWMAHWNFNSLSTPCRPVFNASSPTASGYSLNDLLPKGRNNLNKLVQIFIRWLTYSCGFCTDVQKMYNTIKLAEKHWCYQLFLWEDDLSPEPYVAVMSTLIYGVKSSGNQAECALRETTKLFQDKYPVQNDMIQNDTYVDDCGSGLNVIEEGVLNATASYEEAKTVTDDLQILLNKGGFKLKGITFSGCDPPENLCGDDESVSFAGLKWFPKTDLLSLNIKEPNFGKKSHGKKSEQCLGKIPKRLTRKNCASRVGEVFDLNGRFAPLIAQFKMDLHDLCTIYKIEWKEFINDELFQAWKNNFDTIEQMREIKFQRCVIPHDAVSLEMDIIEMGDSSLKMACSAIYVRFRRKNGSFSCQLVFAKTRIIPSDMTLPRAELFAATLNATTGHVVSTSLGQRVTGRVSLIDNQVSLHWISSVHTKLKQWVRSRVVEINRLTDKNDWYYVESKDNTADLGTRKGAKISDVLDDSVWVNGPNWATQERDAFPVKSVHEIKLSADDLKNFNDEIITPDVTDDDWITSQLNGFHSVCYTSSQPKGLDEVYLRYQFSSYIVDPNKYNFRKVVRIMGLVLKFIGKLKPSIRKAPPVVAYQNALPGRFMFCNDKYLVTAGAAFPFVCEKGLVVELTELNLLEALNYFFRKASDEVRHFLPKSSYENISQDKFGILYYTGRILPSQTFGSKVELSDVCLDLSSSSFCVPIVDKHSPLAYALISEVHWYDTDAKHSGVETLWRYVLKIAYVIEGRALVKKFKDQCARCRYLRKRAIEVVMGPVACENVCIAPPFYNSQVDLFGPFSSYSNVNKRATSKIWFVIFCCCVTGAVDIKVAEDYTTTSFIQAFIRFSCKVGYPRKLLPDAGSQLISGCGNMTISFYDVHNKLSELGTDFEPCPVGAHYMHGKVERKIRDVRMLFSKHLQNHRLSIIQWETLGDQVANSINNLPIALGNVSQSLENLDLLTPNRLMLGRNNSRCPSEKMLITENLGKIIQQNGEIFEVWFRAWLTSCVPNLMIHPKWFRSDIDPQVGDVILFLKSDKEFEKLYQYGIICDTKRSRDGKIRQVDIEYQNHSEGVKRRTTRGTREIVVIHPYDELGLIRELNILATQLE